MAGNDDSLLDDGFRAALERGWRTVTSAPTWLLLAVTALAVLTLSMLPVSMPWSHEQPGPYDPSVTHGQPWKLRGGIWQPLSADAGLIHQRTVAVDFFSIYEAGARFLRGESIYAATPNGTGRAPWSTEFRYPPPAALLLAVPLNALPPWPAYLAWLGLNVAMLGANFLLCVGRRPQTLGIQALVWFAWFPLAVEWYMGQFTFAMGTLLLWGVDALRRNARSGGWMWSLACVLKIYPIGMALPLLLARRWQALVAAGLLLFAASGAWFVAMPKDRVAFSERNVEGRLLPRTRQPYAGAQGVQEGLGAIVWAAQGRDMARGYPAGDGPPASAARDPLVWLGGAVLLAFSGVCAWACWATRGRVDPACLGLLWLAWFFAYRDVWEHHHTAVQCLVGGWLAWGVLSRRAAVLAWLGAGAPSLWWLWHRLSTDPEVLSHPAGVVLGQAVGLAYFLQRPAAVIGLAVVGVMAVRGNPKDQSGD